MPVTVATNEASTVLLDLSFIAVNAVAANVVSVTVKVADAFNAVDNVPNCTLLKLIAPVIPPVAIFATPETTAVI